MSLHESSTDNVDNVINELKIDNSTLGKINGIFDFAEDIFDTAGDIIAIITGKKTTDDADKNEISDAFNKTASDFAKKLSESNLLPKAGALFIKQNAFALGVGVVFLIGVGIFMSRR